jgi:hypothetical protein
MGFFASWLQNRRDLRKAKQSAKAAFVELRKKHPGRVLIYATTPAAYIVNVLYGNTRPPGLSQWSVSRATFLRHRARPEQSVRSKGVALAGRLNPELKLAQYRPPE